MLYFAVPALSVDSEGLVASAMEGWDGLVVTVRDLLRHPQSPYLLSTPNFVGLALIIVGFTIHLVAKGTLRRFHSSALVIRKDHQLITRGIYRFTRHPIYLGMIIVCIGVPVYASSLYGLLTMSALIPIFLNRIRMEERMLTNEFGDAYRTYKEATSKLIAFIY